MFFFLKEAKSVEFYEIKEPHRDILSKNYDNYDIDEEESDRKIIDIGVIGNDFIKRSNKLYAEKKDTEIKIAKDDELKMTKRQRFQQRAKNNDNDTSENIKVEKKKIHRNFMESILPDNPLKPMEMVGAYSSFKLMLAMPVSMKFSANEITGHSGEYKTNQLFDGSARYNLMPAFFISVGNDRFKWWRWEAELGYLPLISSGVNRLNVSKEMSEYSFSVEKKDLSMHLLTFTMNNFLQHDFFNKKLVAFVGLGVGVGYVWSMSKALSSEFVMPIVTGSLGVSFMVGKKSKMNISYTFMYSQMSIPNRYGFKRSKDSTPISDAIRGGKIRFDQLLINGFSIEYLFYTA